MPQWSGPIGTQAIRTRDNRDSAIKQAMVTIVPSATKNEKKDPINMFALSDPVLWWILAALAVAAELFIGMFYLLMVAFGLAAGALAAHLGLGSVGQLITAAIIGSSLVVACYLLRKRQAARLPGADRNINLDIGERVLIEQWQNDGTASVRYRGAQWTAIPAPGTQPANGMHRVRNLDGNHLVVEKIADPASAPVQPQA